jgi:hypothetical protein
LGARCRDRLGSRSRSAQRSVLLGISGFGGLELLHYKLSQLDRRCHTQCTAQLDDARSRELGRGACAGCRRTVRERLAFAEVRLLIGRARGHLADDCLLELARQCQFRCCHFIVAVVIVVVIELI